MKTRAELPRVINVHDRSKQDPTAAVIRGLLFVVLFGPCLVWQLQFVSGDPNPWIVIPWGLLAAYLSQAVRIAKQWEKAVILRLGKFRALRGPGLFLILPIFERIAVFVDQRVRTTDFNTEQTLTKDTVPVNVDAICFWLVWDVEKAILEVEDYFEAVVLSAQTALRDIIGRHELAEVLTDRERLGEQLREALDRKTTPWGMTIQSVEIRDVIIPTLCRTP